MSTPRVSVIVPVYDDPHRLRTCLEALERQTYPADRYEVIVVDNGSPEPVAPLVAGFRQARSTFEPRPGSYVARNRGIVLATGEILAFTDADCVPAPDWIEQGVAGLRGAPDCGLVGGRVAVFYQDPTHPTAVERFTTVAARDQRRLVEVERYAETSNVFTWRRVIEQVGPFDPSLKSCGDLVWGRRVSAAGYRPHYSATAVVHHPAMRSLAQAHHRYTRLVGGKYDISRRADYAGLAATRTSSIDLSQLVYFAHRICRDPRLPNWGVRLQVLGVLLFVQGVAMVERVRLRLGGTSRR